MINLTEIHANSISSFIYKKKTIYRSIKNRDCFFEHRQIACTHNSMNSPYVYKHLDIPHTYNELKKRQQTIKIVLIDRVQLRNTKTCNQ